MNPSTNRLTLVIFPLLILLLLIPSIEGKVFKWENTPGQSRDLLILGFGEVTTQMLDISGNKTAFELSNPNLKDELSANYRMSLFANGNPSGKLFINGVAIVDSRIGDEYRTVDPSIFRLKMSMESTEPIWDGWRFTGRGLYDPNREWELANLDTRLLTQPQEPSKLELLMRLSSEEHGEIEAGSLRPSFKGSKFTLQQRSIFGVYADIHNEKVGAEAVGGKLEGKTFREGTVVGIRADGTSGPYDMSNAPITRGSETVKIEERDRFDETTVLSTRTLIRDIDYNVDYLRGRILLHRPVTSETVAGDPVYIVITYDYQRDENDEIIGGRAKITPTDELKFSGSYLHRNVDNNAIGAGLEEPEDLIAGDFDFTLKDHTSGYLELANVNNQNDNSDYGAVRFGATSKVIENLALSADFQRIDDQYRSFTNSNLDPTKNQQRIKLGGKFDITESQSAKASYVNLRGLEANGEFNPYDGLREEAIYSGGYQNKLIKQFGFSLGAERREVTDRDNLAHEDNYQNRAIVNLGGLFEAMPLFGDLNYKANFEQIIFRNELLLGRNNSNTSQGAVSLTSDPSENARFEFTQRLAVRKDKDLDTYDDRQDVTFVKVRLRPHTNLNTLTTYEYKRYTIPGDKVDLWQDDPQRTNWAGTFALEYIPIEKIKALGKFGRQQSKSWATDSSYKTVTDFLLGQLTYFPAHHLSLNGETELRTKNHYTGTEARTKTWDLGLRVNWNRDRLNEFTVGLIRRWQLFETPPGAEITSSSYIMLASGSVSFARYFFGRASIKEILLNDPLDDEKTFTKVEVGYDSHQWFRVSLGFERIESDVKDSPDLDYTGQGIFIRLSGKM